MPDHDMYLVALYPTALETPAAFLPLWLSMIASAGLIWRPCSRRYHSRNRSWICCHGPSLR